MDRKTKRQGLCPMTPVGEGPPCLALAVGFVSLSDSGGGSKRMLRSLQQYGMTPLMHGAYKGKADMCKLLLQHGADVNCNEHEHGYTALMFAGLSGTAKDISLIGTQTMRACVI